MGNEGRLAQRISILKSTINSEKRYTHVHQLSMVIKYGKNGKDNHCHAHFLLFADHINIHTQQYYFTQGMVNYRIFLLPETKCGLPLGMSTGEIKAIQVSASSSFASFWPNLAMLNSYSIWCADPTDKNPSLTVSFSY